RPRGSLPHHGSRSDAQPDRLGPPDGRAAAHAEARMVAQAADSKRVKPGSRVPVVMVPNARPAKLRAKATALLGQTPPVDYLSRPSLAYYLLHTRYARTPDARDTYDPILLELGILLDEYSRAVADYSMIQALGDAKTTVHGSKRAIWSPARLQAGSN